MVADLVIGGDGIRLVCFLPLLIFLANWPGIGSSAKCLPRPRYSIYRQLFSSQGRSSSLIVSRVGRTIWRVIIPKSLIIDIPIMTSSTAWWHGLAGHFYNCLVDDPSETPEEEQIFEIAVHNVVPAASVKEKRFSWGIPATNERVESHFTEYDPIVLEVLSRVPYGLWKEFSSFAGPRLEEVTAWDKVVLIDDASHPLAGMSIHAVAFFECPTDG